MSILKQELMELESIVRDSKSIAESLGAESIVNMFRVLLEKMRKPQLYLCLVGRTSSGKTTLVNSLLGEERFPNTAAPTTGILTEIYNSDDENLHYYKVNDKMERHEISEAQFDSYLIKPDSFKGRLQMSMPEFRHRLSARIFDTPGYDSIYEQHTDILKGFIPEVDYLVFTVMYRAGLVQSDKEFLELLFEVFGQSLPPMILVINRIPTELKGKDKRIIEIEEGVRNIIKQKVDSFLIDEDTRGEFPLPDTDHLWEYLAKETNSLERQQLLIDNVKLVQEALLEELKEYIIYLKQIREADDEKIKQLRLEIDKLKVKTQEIYDLIHGRKSDIIKISNRELDNAVLQIEDEAYSVIEQAGRWTQASECTTFLTNHFLPRQADGFSKKIGTLIFNELEKLNREVEDLVNTAIGNFKVNIDNVLFEENSMRENLLRKLSNEGLKKVAFGFFAKFGGRGGAGAGIANFASKVLSKAGKLFGKTFSKATHNGLKQLIKRIGLTSARGIQAAVAVIIEVIFYLINVATWKNKLQKNTREAIEKWAEELRPKLVEEIDTSIKETEVLVEEHVSFGAKDIEEIVEKQQSYSKNADVDLDKFTTELANINRRFDNMKSNINKGDKVI